MFERAIFSCITSMIENSHGLFTYLHAVNTVYGLTKRLQWLFQWWFIVDEGAICKGDSKPTLSVLTVIW